MTSNYKQDESVYTKLCNFMERNTKGVEIGIYTASGLMFAFAYYKVRPISKFIKPADIPRHFIKNRLPQNGKVVRVDPTETSGPILMINHKPPVNLRFLSTKLLPVKVSGIEINSNGYSWLHSVLTDRKIMFVPLSRERTVADCQVFLLEKNGKTLDVGKALLSLGFARLEPVPRVVEWDKNFVEYYEALKSVQRKAKKYRAGLWDAMLPSPPIYQRLLNNVWRNLANRKLPELVR